MTGVHTRVLLIPLRYTADPQAVGRQDKSSVLWFNGITWSYIKEAMMSKIAFHYDKDGNRVGHSTEEDTRSMYGSPSRHENQIKGIKREIITQFHYANQAEPNRYDRHPVSGKSRSNQV